MLQLLKQSANLKSLELATSSKRTHFVTRAFAAVSQNLPDEDKDEETVDVASTSAPLDYLGDTTIRGWCWLIAISFR